MRAHSSKYAEWKAICRTLSLGYQPQLAHDAPADRFQPGMVRPARRHRGVEPDAAQRGIGGMGLGLAIAPFAAPGDGQQIGRASCRERVCQYVLSCVVAVSLKKKHSENTI